MKIALIIAFSAFVFSAQVYAHGGEDHGKKVKQDTVGTEAVEQDEHGTHEHANHDSENGAHHYQHSDENKPLKANLDDFPTLHPLVVHFPIVLLMLAALSQLLSLFIFKRELSWITLFLVAGGFVGAYIAGSYVHPHTAGLSDYAERVLTEHETYASYSTWLGGIALVLKALSQFLLKRKLWGEIVVAVVLLASAYTVSVAGHYGAQLIYIEGIGAQGKHLESGHHNHEH